MGKVRKAEFDMDKKFLQARYKKALWDSRKISLFPRENAELDRFVYMYAKEHGITFDQAFIIAKTGKEI